MICSVGNENIQACRQELRKLFDLGLVVTRPQASGSLSHTSERSTKLFAMAQKVGLGKCVMNALKTIEDEKQQEIQVHFTHFTLIQKMKTTKCLFCINYIFVNLYADGRPNYTGTMAAIRPSLRADRTNYKITICSLRKIKCD